MAVQASAAGGDAVVLESVQVWELGSCWINETTALQMIADRDQQGNRKGAV